MALEHKFSLTPVNSYTYTGNGHYAYMGVWGAYNFPNNGDRAAFDHQHASDELYFYVHMAGNPAADYTNWLERYRVPCVRLYYNLSAFEPYKEVALTFSFDAVMESRILIYTDTGLLDEEILHVGDNQFLIEIESTDPLYLYFIHAQLDGASYGGNWYFQGIDGYIA